jgi:hypothetical protein
MNKIFDEKIMSELKRVSSTDARAVSLKKMLLMVCYRCQELENRLSADIDAIREKMAS